MDVFEISDRILGRADTAEHIGRGRHRGAGERGNGRWYDKAAVPVHRQTRAESALETQGQPSHRGAVGRRQGETRYGNCVLLIFS